MTTATTGWVACDYTTSDYLADVRHGEIRGTSEQATADYRAGEYDGIRFVGADGCLYVEQPE